MRPLFKRRGIEGSYFEIGLAKATARTFPGRRYRVLTALRNLHSLLAYGQIPQEFGGFRWGR